MNKFREFDKIKTPEDWKYIDITQKQSNRVYIKPRLGYIFLCLMICLSSIGFVYAMKKDFRIWIHEQFGFEKVEEIPALPFNDGKTLKEQKFTISDIFMYSYIYDENNDQIDIQEVSVFQDGQFVLKDTMHMEGNYDNQNYSFDYVSYNDHIFTFNEKGFIINILPLINNNIVYFQSSDNNLCTLDLVTKEISTITNDHNSVNFKISPDKTYITINKNDKYWTIYNTKTKKEKRLEGLDPYAHNEEYGFYNDKYMICYDEDGMTCLIDLATNKITNLHEECLYPEISTFTFEFKDQQTIIHDVYLKKDYKINGDFSQYHYTIFDNHYIVFDSFQDKKIMIVDFKNQRHKVLDYKGTEEDIDVNFMDDEKYLLVSNDKQTYMISIEEVFSE